MCPGAAARRRSCTWRARSGARCATSTPVYLLCTYCLLTVYLLSTYCTYGLLTRYLLSAYCLFIMYRCASCAATPVAETARQPVRRRGCLISSLRRWSTLTTMHCAYFYTTSILAATLAAMPTANSSPRSRCRPNCAPCCGAASEPEASEAKAASAAVAASEAARPRSGQSCQSCIESCLKSCQRAPPNHPRWLD